jgi:hypothetical protein
MSSETTIQQPPTPAPPAAAPRQPRERPAHRSVVGHLHLPKLRPLSLGVRVTLHVLGWLLTIIGVAGFFLPVIPGALALGAGLALLSVASRRLHLWLRPKFRRWPRAWRRLERFRRRLHRRLEPPE